MAERPPMVKSGPGVPVGFELFDGANWMLLKLDNSGPLYRQIYSALRGEILSGVRGAGSPVPPTRQLAGELGCSRNVVTLAYDQLLAEGYLQSRRGSGTFVAPTLVRQRPGERRSRRAEGPLHLSELSKRLLAETGRQRVAWQKRSPPPPYDFWYGRPPLADFPHDAWCRLLGRVARQATLRRLDYGPPEGVPELRQAIAAYVHRARGVVCSAEQVLIVNGFQQGVDLVSRVLLNPGDRVVVEEPHYRPARLAFLAVGAEVVGVAVDGDGLRVAELPSDGIRLVYVTPSHQFPTGVVLPLARRLELLAWAVRCHAYVLEDDYNGEFRYGGRPVETLQGLDDRGRVLYAGTFSKVMFPALRMGYLIVPEPLIEAFVTAKALADAGGPTIIQVALAELIDGGQFERHIRRARARNAVRRRAMLEAIEQHLGDGREVVGADAGLHVMLRLRNLTQRRFAELRRRAREQGVGIYPAAPFYLEAPPQTELLLGYASLTEAEIREGIRRLGRVMKSSGNYLFNPNTSRSFR
jgi:GntR family transcriptional regulator/MocR family aminotransferase